MVYYFDKDGKKRTFDYVEDLLKDVVGEDWVEERLNESLDPIKYGTAEYPAGTVLRKIDPVMFGEYEADLIWELVERIAFTNYAPEINPEDGAMIYLIKDLGGLKIYILDENEEIIEQ